jgi:hypothetical protein
MKPLSFILLLLLSNSANSAMEIIESSIFGPSYLDTYNNILTVNLQSTVANPDVTLGNAQCGTLIMEDRVVDGSTVQVPRVDESRTCEVSTFSGCSRIEVPVNNPANDQGVYITHTADGKEVIERRDKPNCEAARQTEVLSNSRYCKDNESPTLILTLQQQATCNNNQACAPPAAATPSVKSFPVPQSEINNCSPQHQNVVIRNRDGGPSMLASFRQNEHCGQRFGPRQIQTGNLLWDQENKPEYQIKVDDQGGFRIGDHTHYYFDFQKNQWCNHFIPTNRETCSASFTGATIPIAYTTGEALANSADRSNWRNKGVVKLEVIDGKPVATVGHAMSSNFNDGAVLNEERPVLRVTMSDTETSGRRAVFELRETNQPNAQVRGRIEVSPTYSLGTELTSNSETCDANRCLNVPSLLLTSVADRQLQCTNNHKLDLTTSTNLCYSCNGITSGSCSTSTILISRDGNRTRSSVPGTDPRTYRRVSDVTADFNSCGRAAPALPTTTDI